MSCQFQKGGFQLLSHLTSKNGLGISNEHEFFDCFLFPHSIFDFQTNVDISSFLTEIIGMSNSFTDGQTNDNAGIK